MREVDATTEIVRILARRNVELSIEAEFLESDNSPADISSFGVSAFLADALADDTQVFTLEITDTVVPGASYWIRDDEAASVTVVIGADTSKPLQTGKNYYLQVYLTDSGKPVKDILYEIRFKAGGKE